MARALKTDLTLSNIAKKSRFEVIVAQTNVPRKTGWGFGCFKNEYESNESVLNMNEHVANITMLHPMADFKQFRCKAPQIFMMNWD